MFSQNRMSAESSIVACPHCGKKNRVGTTASGRPVCGRCRRDLPWVVDADDVSFATAIDTPTLTLVDLWAPWCGPCRLVSPVLERLASSYAGRLKVVKVNVDESPAIASRYRATSIPMLLFLGDGSVLDTVVGALPEHLLQQRIYRLLPTDEPQPRAS
jgi:thioredoxin 2